MSNANQKSILIAVLVIAALMILYGVLTIPDQRTPTERVGDAIHALPEGADKAARELEKRTPGERLGDAVKDVTDNE